MMDIEDNAELYQFQCRWCATTWTEEYQSRTVTFPDGETRVLYRKHSLACMAPTSADVMCWHCHHGPVDVALLTSGRAVLPPAAESA